ncbi:hypothetical protein GEMRC1_013911 [Eukaryota sp. GEM-RC1]
MLSGAWDVSYVAVERFTYGNQPRGIYTGNRVSLILTNWGSLEGGGTSNERLLGTHTSSNTKVTTGIENLSGMHCDNSAVHALGITSDDGRVVGWGLDESGSFGTGSSTSQVHSTRQSVGCVAVYV